MMKNFKYLNKKKKEPKTSKYNKNILSNTIKILA